MNGPEGQDYITIPEAAALLQVSDKTIRREIKRGKLTTIRRGDSKTYQVLVLRADAEKLAREQAAPTKPKEALSRVVRDQLWTLSTWTVQSQRLGQATLDTVHGEARKTRYFVLGAALLVAIWGAWTVHRQRLDSRKNAGEVSRGLEAARVDTVQAIVQAREEAKTAQETTGKELAQARGELRELRDQVAALSGQIRELVARTPAPTPTPEPTPAITPEAPRAHSPGPARTPEESGFLGIF